METRRRALFSWLALGLLAGLCGLLALLQYRWIGEVSRAESANLREDLEAALQRFSAEFNSEINQACWTLVATSEEIAEKGREAAYSARYSRWKATGRHEPILRRVALAIPDGRQLVLSILDPDRGEFKSAPWPAEWSAARDAMLRRLQGDRPGPFTWHEAALIELPRFGPPGRPGALPEQEWLLAELNLDYVRETFLPGLVSHHLGSGGGLNYRVEIVTRTDPPDLIYQSDPETQHRIGEADASATLFDMEFGPRDRRPAPNVAGAQKAPPPLPPRTDSGRGRWQILARHRADSLDAVVDRARRRNLAVSAGILVLMLVTAFALMRFTRQSQRLAELQMNFVAGVSHELRTPLTVISTAAYNLRGKLAHNPAQVERYSSLIQAEAGKLAAIIEQILQFASTKAGRSVRHRQSLSAESLIDEAVEASRTLLDSAGCAVEKRIEPGLPSIHGDPMALKHAVENLIGNAVKHGAQGGNWVGVYASALPDHAVEIRVADRGPGIPADEQTRIFEPFFRGRHAVHEQIRGTGLGLNLVKRIVEAHGGTVALRSQPGQGAEFIVRLPAAPEERQHELAHSARRG